MSPRHAAGGSFLCACLIVVAIAPGAAVDPWQAARTPLEAVELATPFTVREVKGHIYSSRRQPLEDANFEVALSQHHDTSTSVGVSTDARGFFRLTTPHDPLGWLFGQAWAIRRGPHRFKAVQEGFHPTTGIVIVSPDAPKDNEIEVLLQPGPDADDRTPEQRAADWDRIQLPPCEPGVNRNPARRAFAGLLDMPVSLGVCLLRTPEIAVPKNSFHRFMLEADASLGDDRMNCMLGLSPPLTVHCLDNDPLLKADWTVWQGDRAIARGSSPLGDHGRWSANSFAKYLGYFDAEARKTYVVELKFLKDGSAINAANPHLVIQ